MKVGYIVTLKDERGTSHNAKIIKVHPDKSLNLQIKHRNGNTQMYNGISETPKIKIRILPRIPYWDKQNKPDMVKVVKETSSPKKQKKAQTTNKSTQTKI